MGADLLHSVNRLNVGEFSVLAVAEAGTHTGAWATEVDVVIDVYGPSAK